MRLKIFNPYVRAQTFAVGSMHPTMINASRTNDLLSVKAMQGLGIRYSSWMRSRTDIQCKRSALVVRRCEFTIRHSTPTDKTQPPILNSRPKRWNNCPVSKSFVSAPPEMVSVAWNQVSSYWLRFHNAKYEHWAVWHSRHPQLQGSSLDENWLAILKYNVYLMGFRNGLYHTYKHQSWDNYPSTWQLPRSKDSIPCSRMIRQMTTIKSNSSPHLSLNNRPRSQHSTLSLNPTSFLWESWNNGLELSYALPVENSLWPELNARFVVVRSEYKPWNRICWWKLTHKCHGCINVCVHDRWRPSCLHWESVEEYWALLLQM